MPILIGVILALFVALYARFVRLDRQRAFYSAVLIVVATYYALFAVLGGSVPALLRESIAIAAFLTLAALGFRLTPWILVAGLACHGVFDLLHPHIISNPGVPPWWPGFCLGFDVMAAACLAWIILTHRSSAPPLPASVAPTSTPHTAPR